MNRLRTAAALALRPRPLSIAKITPARHVSSSFDSTEYTSPFTKGETRTTTIPDFSKYRGGSTKGNQLFGYFMVGTMGILSAAGAKAAIQGTSEPLASFFSWNSNGI
jgi:ubiquinol-cytochrome c reductase iron-sulfur subunit